jgi:surface polysaccharide O-acyltransferase-like enzyme
MQSLYVLKAVCAFLIVFIHLPGISVEATVLQPIMRVGVPVFLMISGYFLVGNDGFDRNRLKRQLRKTIKLTINVYCIYIAFIVIRNVLLGKYVINPNWLNIDFVIRMIFVGDNIDSILWYMTAYIEALFLFFFLSKWFNSENLIKVLGLVAPILLLIAVLFNRYSNIIGGIYDIACSRNALTVAIPCMSLGAVLRVYQNKIKQDKILTWAIALMVASYIEYYVLHHFNIKGSGGDFNLMTFPFAFSVFLYCVMNPDLRFTPSRIKGLLGHVGKNWSGDIYLYHSLVWQMLMLLVLTMNIRQSILLFNAETVIILLLIYSVLKENIKQRWTLLN